MVQTCIVHLVRHSLNFCSWKDRKAVAADLRFTALRPLTWPPPSSTISRRNDAAMLARMGAVLELEATPVRSESMHDIRELHIARLGLIKDRTACRNRLQAARNKVVLAQLCARLRQVERQIRQIDAKLARLVAEDPGLAHRSGILLSIPGIGPVAAIAMLVEMPELGTIDGKEESRDSPP